MKVTIYLDKSTTDYYKTLAEANRVPLRTLLRTLLSDFSVSGYEQAKKNNETLNEILRDSIKKAFKEML